MQIDLHGKSAIVTGVGRGIAWIASGPLLLPLDGPAPEPTVIAEVFVALRQELAVRQGHILRLRLPGIAFHDEREIAVIAKAAGFFDVCG